MDEALMTKDEILAALAEDEYVDWTRTPYVACDEPCFASHNPRTPDEVQAALTHWMLHTRLGGCSHGR